MNISAQKLTEIASDHGGSGADQPVCNSIRIRGGKPLRGSVQIGGAKNATLPIMAAALLTEEQCILENVPILNDIFVMADLLRHLGAEVEVDSQNHRVSIKTGCIRQHDAPAQLVEQIRASFLVSGPVLARTGKMKIAAPGGDKIGNRPVDVDVRGFIRMGAQVQVDNGAYLMDSNRLEGTEIFMDYPSHTGTENLLMAASLARGSTTIINAAPEPEIVSVGNVLREMGANVSGVGSPVIEVRGVERLHGFHSAILPDRLEAGTFAIGAATTGGEVVLERVNEADMLPLTHKLRETGAEVWRGDGSMLVRGNERIDPVELQALPFPGFPTDLQAAFTVLLTQAEGTSKVHDRVYNDRLRYLSELEKMGVKYELINNQEARILGPVSLQGADVSAFDIRAGASLILAGLAADGDSTVNEIHHVRRGYEDIVGKFQALGADIQYI